MKMSVELSKLERRKWQPKWTPVVENINHSNLDLPVPSIITPSQNSSLKLNFLHMLGLQTLPCQVSYEYELNWLRVVEERIKRNCASSITDYSLKVHQTILESINANNKFKKCLRQTENLLYKQIRDDQRYLKYLKKPFTINRNKVIESASLSEIALPVIVDRKFNNPKYEEIANDGIIVPTYHRHKTASQRYREVYHQSGVIQRCPNYDYTSNYKESYKIRNTAKLNIFKPNNSQPNNLCYMNNLSIENYFNDSIGNDNKIELKKEVKIENGYDYKKYSNLMETNKSHLKPSIIGNDSPKGLKSTYIQTESNYVLPLTMILVDNRAIQQGTFNDQVSNSTLKNNKSVQCLIEEDVVNLVSKKAKRNSINSSCLLLNNSKDVVKWPGIHKIVESYHLYSKDRDAEMSSLKESLKHLREILFINQTEAKSLERSRRMLQSASSLYEQDRIQLQKEIDNFNTIVNAFR